MDSLLYLCKRNLKNKIKIEYNYDEGKNHREAY